MGWYGWHGLVWVAWVAWTGMDLGWHGVTTMASPLYSVVDRMKKVQLKALSVRGNSCEPPVGGGVLTKIALDTTVL
jgi:hypothetical protein